MRTTGATKGTEKGITDADVLCTWRDFRTEIPVEGRRERFRKGVKEQVWVMYEREEDWWGTKH